MNDFDLSCCASGQHEDGPVPALVNLLCVNQQNVAQQDVNKQCVNQRDVNQ